MANSLNLIRLIPAEGFEMTIVRAFDAFPPYPKSGVTPVHSGGDV